MITECRIPGKEFTCEIVIAKDKVVARDYKTGKEIIEISLDDTINAEVVGNELTITTATGDQLTIAVTAELIDKLQYVMRYIEIKEKGSSAIDEVIQCVKEFSKVLDHNLKILELLRRGSFPDWDLVKRIALEINEATTRMTQHSAPFTASKDLLTNVKKRHIDGIRLTIKSIIRESSNALKYRISKVLLSVNMSSLVDIVILIHVYVLAKKHGLVLVSEKAINELRSTMEIFHPHILPLNEETSRSLTFWIIDLIREHIDANIIVEKYLDRLRSELLTHYHITAI